MAVTENVGTMTSEAAVDMKLHGYKAAGAVMASRTDGEAVRGVLEAQMASVRKVTTKIIKVIEFIEAQQEKEREAFRLLLSTCEKLVETMDSHEGTDEELAEKLAEQVYPVAGAAIEMARPFKGPDDKTSDTKGPDA